MAVSYSTIYSVLAYEKKKKNQPVYFTGLTLQSAKERYQTIEILVQNDEKILFIKCGFALKRIRKKRGDIF